MAQFPAVTIPDGSGTLHTCDLRTKPLEVKPRQPAASRIALAAAHVVADPLADASSSESVAIDWERTLAYRRHLASLGLGIAEAMDTAQRGMGLTWTDALELIRLTCKEITDVPVFCGCGTDQLDPAAEPRIEDIIDAYLQQADQIQQAGGRLIVMASRALARAAQNPADYALAYSRVLAGCEQPVILHWLGDMFDPQLAGYWGSADLDKAEESCLAIISESRSKIDGIKISLLNKDREIAFRRKLPEGVRLYTGDDFSYPELIAGDEHGYSDALLGIFDPIAPAASAALAALDNGDEVRFRELLDPTVKLARTIFCAPTRNYKSGVVFLAWLNCHQDHFIMLGGAQSQRSLLHYAEVFRLAEQCGLLSHPADAAQRMRELMAVYGIR